MHKNYGYPLKAGQIKWVAKIIDLSMVAIGKLPNFIQPYSSP